MEETTGATAEEETTGEASEEETTGAIEEATDVVTAELATAEEVAWVLVLDVVNDVDEEEEEEEEEEEVVAAVVVSEPERPFKASLMASANGSPLTVFLKP